MIPTFTTQDDFWKEVAMRTTPLLDPIDGDDAHMYVTFRALLQAGQTILSILIPTLCRTFSALEIDLT